MRYNFFEITMNRIGYRFLGVMMIFFFAGGLSEVAAQNPDIAALKKKAASGYVCPIEPGAVPTAL